MCPARNRTGLRRRCCMPARRLAWVEDEDNQPPNGHLSAGQQGQVGRTSRRARISGWAYHLADPAVRGSGGNRAAIAGQADKCGRSARTGTSRFRRLNRARCSDISAPAASMAAGVFVGRPCCDKRPTRSDTMQRYNNAALKCIQRGNPRCHQLYLIGNRGWHVLSAMNDSTENPSPIEPTIRTSAAASSENEPPTTGSLFLKIFPSIMLPMFMAVADQTIVATALPAIASSLGEIERASWVVVSYLIANTIAAPVYGRLGDTFGRRSMMIIALVIFMVGSVLCALSPNIEFLTAARVLQGFGGGGLMTLSQALVGETIPPRERGRYQGYLAGVSVSSSTFGPVAGGYLTQIFGWQSIFLINVPLGLAAVLLVLRLKTRPGDRRRTTFDVPGLVLFMMFVSPVILALEEVQRMDARTL